MSAKHEGEAKHGNRGLLELRLLFALNHARAREVTTNALEKTGRRQRLLPDSDAGGDLLL